MVEKGKPWERPATGPADHHVDGDDATLAAAVRDRPGVRVGFRPNRSSDLARALGLHAAAPATHELVLDGMSVVVGERVSFAVNMVVVGTAPDRANWFTRARALRVEVDGRVAHDGPATAVVIASGQYLRGNDVVPRGHPGDGRLEVQVYAVRRRDRVAVRRRLPQGVHVPHPDIIQTVGRRIEVVAVRGAEGLEIDGMRAAPAAGVTVEVVPEAFVIVV